MWKSKLLGCICVLLCSTAAYAEHKGKEERQVSVVGQAVVHHPADILEIVLGVETYAKEVKEAVEENKSRMAKVVASLVQGGIPQQEIHTQEYTVLPQSLNSQGAKPGETGESGYQVRNLIQIRTAALDKAGVILDLAMQAGGNQVEGVYFRLKNMPAARQAALAQAVHQAGTIAQTVAQEAGLKVGEVLSMNVQGVYSRGMGPRVAQRAGGGDAETFIAPQDVEVSASVAVVYALEGRKASKA